LAASACGGGGGGGGETPTNVVLSGVVTFDFVPAVAGAGLDHDATQARPVRGATVEVVAGSSASVLGSVTTGADGAYSVSVPVNTSAFVRVKAQMQQTGTPSWNFRVVDNVNGNALYALDSSVFNTGTTALTRDLHAPSGWGGSSYTGERSAAPFAILDTVHEAAAYVLVADPTAVFPPLTLHWSIENVPVFGADGQPDPDTGEIGTSFASIELGGIFLLGAEDQDTEEYDRHVIVHEWGHYFEYEFSRTDSVGGPHSRHDQLDMRVAFSEGFSTALSALALGQSVYRDTHGPQQGSTFTINVEGPALLQAQNQNPGWYSEESIQEIVYDIVDADPDGPDQLQMDFADVYSVVRNGLRTSVAMTSIFSLIHHLKDGHPADAALIDEIVTGQSIAPVLDVYGTGEGNNGNPGSPDVLPVYRQITVNDPPVEVCSTDEFGDSNKLGSRQFLRFSVGADGTHTFTAVATSIPAGEVADPDMVLHRGGALLPVSEESPADDCSDQTPANCTETFSRNLSVGDYVLEVYEFTNTESEDSDFPPIGHTCFEVSVTQP
jgi:hypothetical protein